MAEKPLLVSGPLIRPIQTGEKTETRRMHGLDQVNSYPSLWNFKHMEYVDATQTWRAVFSLGEKCGIVKINCPYGGTGTNLWVRESFYVDRQYDKARPSDLPDYIKRGYMADGEKPQWAGKTRTSIHMPRWLSRLDLENLETYPERLHDITEAGANAEGATRAWEGCEDGHFYHPDDQTEKVLGQLGSYVIGFKAIWLNVNDRDSWDRNPWVWVIKFKLKT